MSRLHRVLSLTIVATLATPGAALAVGTVSIDSLTAAPRFISTADEVNVVTVREDADAGDEGYWEITDSAAGTPAIAGDMTSTMHCRAGEDANEVECISSGTDPYARAIDVRLGPGDDSLNVALQGPGGGSGAESIMAEGGADDDVLYGSEVQDTIAGSPGDDQLFGLHGDDVLSGQDGSDAYSGGPGADTFSDNGQHGTETDRVDYAVLDPRLDGVTVTIDGVANDGADDIDARTGETARRDNVQSGIELVSGSPYADTLTGQAVTSSNASPQGVTLNGQSGDDVITGGGGHDTLLGNTEDDTISGQDSLEDTVDCGAGTDSATLDALPLDDPATGCETVDRSAEDTTPPVVTINSPSGTIETRRPEFSGTKSDEPTTESDTVYLTLERFDGTRFVDVDSDGGGPAPASDHDLEVSVDGTTWFAAWGSSSARVDLVDGEYRATARQYDPSDNVGTAVRTFTIGQSAPMLTITGPSSTKERRPQFSGTKADEPALADDVVRLTIRTRTGTVVRTDEVTADGTSWSLRPGADLVDGDYTAVVQQEDAAGNAGEDDRDFRVDNVEPTVTLTSPTDQQRFTDPATVGIAGVAPDEPGSELRIEIRKDSASGFQPVADDIVPSRNRASGDFRYDFKVPSAGRWFARVYHSDGAGNVGSAPVIWFVDAPAPPPPPPANRPPVITVTGLEQPIVEGTTVAPVVSCSDPDGDKVPVCRLETVFTETPGVRTVTATATDARGATTTQQVPYTVVPAPATQGIQVQLTRVVQATSVSRVSTRSGTQRPPDLPFDVAFDDETNVHLVAGREAYGYVMVAATRPVDVYLHVYSATSADGRRTLLRVLTPEADGDTSSKTAAAKLLTGTGYRFRVPGELMTGRRDFVGVAVPRTTPNGASCRDCGPTNGYALVNVQPQVAKGFRVNFAQMQVDGRISPAVGQLVERALQTLPVRRDKVELPSSYDVNIDITDIANRATEDLNKATDDAKRAEIRTRRQSEALDRLGKWNEDQGKDLGGITIGVGPKSFKFGVSYLRAIRFGATCDGGVLGIGCRYDRPSLLLSVDDRPLTSAAHEIGHSLGRPHASDCGGGAKGGYQFWPSDGKGYLQGVGFDPVGLDGFGPFRVVSTQVDTVQKWDYMSYCARPLGGQDPTAWISPRGWEASFAALRTTPLGGNPVEGIQFSSDTSTQFRAADGHLHARSAGPDRFAARRLRQAGGGTVDVRAVVTEGGQATVTSVQPGAAPPGPQDATYRLVARDAAGQTTMVVPMAADAVHENQGGSAVLLRAPAPAATTASVVLVGPAGPIAQRSKSPAAPVVRASRPVAARSGAVTLRWTATDADPDSALRARVDWSADGGKTWETVADGPSDGVEVMPAGRLERTSRARLRVTVSDGWNETAALSPVFATAGAAPDLRLLSPEARTRTRNDQPLTLTATATDDRGTALTGRRLVWRVGRRVVGRGTRVTTALTAGRPTVSVTATDRFGRTSRASRTVRVAAATPHFTTLRGPAKVGAAARTVRLRVAASVRGTLRAGGRRYAVSPRARTVTVRIARGARAVSLVLSAAGRTSRSQLRLR